MLWLALIVPLTVFIAMYENFGLRKGFRVTVWSFFVVSNALAIAFAVNSNDLTVVLLTFAGGGVLALVFDKAGSAAIEFAQGIFKSWGGRKSSTKAAEEQENAKREARLQSAFRTPLERSQQAAQATAAAKWAVLQIVDHQFSGQVRPEFEAFEKYLSKRDVLCSVKQVFCDEPTGQLPWIAFLWGHVEQGWGRFIDHELRFEVDPESGSMVVRFAIVGGQSGPINKPDRLTEAWISDTLVGLIDKSMSVGVAYIDPAT